METLQYSDKTRMMFEITAGILFERFQHNLRRGQDKITVQQRLSQQTNWGCYLEALFQNYVMKRKYWDPDVLFIT